MPSDPVLPIASQYEGFRSERLLAFDRIPNFRDYGGYVLPGAGRIPKGLLYRSSHHADATEGDLRKIADLGLRAIVDLRGSKERIALPSRRAEGSDVLLFEVAEETGGLLGPLLKDTKIWPGEIDAAWLMREGYATMPFRWRMRGVLRNHFEALGTIDGPVLVHCMAGKDRTGLAVALLQDLLGLHRDDILADFLLTNEAGKPDLRGHGPNSIRVTFGAHLSDGQVATLSSVRAEYLEAALDAVQARHGSTEAYLTQALGVPATWIEAIRARLIE